MNPSSNESAGLNLPPPIPEQAPGVPKPEEGKSALPEQAPTAPERSAGVAQPVVAAPPPIQLPVPPLAPPATSTDDVTSTTKNTDLAALDDNDLIEKEWVNKAKQIVERTRDDPYQQSEQLTGVKADYMKKRYNKTIRLK